MNQVKFAKLASLRKNKYDPKKDTSNYFCVELEHLSQNSGHILGSVSSSKQNSIKNKFFPNDVLFGKLRPYLNKYAHPDFAGVCSTEIWVFEPKNTVTSNYLFYLIQSSDFLQVANITSGTKMPRASWKVVSDSLFSVPSIEQQKKIAKILSIWDEAIEAVGNLIEKNEKLLRSLLYKTVGVKNEPNCKLSEIAKVKHGKSQKQVEDKTGKYPILATGGIIGFSNKFLTDKPCTLIGRKGTIDKPGYMDKPFWHVDTLFRIEAGKKLISKWLYYYFLTINWSVYNQGAVLPSLTSLSVGSIKLFLPKLEKQQKDIEILNSIEETINHLKNKKKLLTKQKKGLMQKLLTGKVSVN